MKATYRAYLTLSFVERMELWLTLWYNSQYITTDSDLTGNGWK